MGAKLTLQKTWLCLYLVVVANSQTMASRLGNYALNRNSFWGDDRASIVEYHAPGSLDDVTGSSSRHVSASRQSRPSVAAMARDANYTSELHEEWSRDVHALLHPTMVSSHQQSLSRWRAMRGLPVEAEASTVLMDVAPRARRRQCSKAPRALVILKTWSVPRAPDFFKSPGCQSPAVGGP